MRRVFLSQVSPAFGINLTPVTVLAPFAQPCSQPSSTFPNPPVAHSSAMTSIPQAAGRVHSQPPPLPPPYIPVDKSSTYFKAPQARAPVAVGSERQQQRSVVDAHTPPGAPPTKHTRHDEATLRQMRLLKRTSVEVLPGYSSPMDCCTEHPKSKEKQQFHDHTAQQLTEAKPSTSGHFEHEHQNEYELETRVPGGPSLRTVNSDPHLVGLVGALQQSPLTTECNPMISVTGRDLNSPFLMQSDSSSSVIHGEGLCMADIQREATAMETGETVRCETGVAISKVEMATLRETFTTWPGSDVRAIIRTGRCAMCLGASPSMSKSCFQTRAWVN